MKHVSGALSLTLSLAAFSRVPFFQELATRKKRLCCCCCQHAGVEEEKKEGKKLPTIFLQQCFQRIFAKFEPLNFIFIETKCKFFGEFFYFYVFCVYCFKWFLDLKNRIPHHTFMRESEETASQRVVPLLSIGCFCSMFLNLCLPLFF